MNHGSWTFFLSRLKVIFLSISPVPRLKMDSLHFWASIQSVFCQFLEVPKLASYACFGEKRGVVASTPLGQAAHIFIRIKYANPKNYNLGLFRYSQQLCLAFILTLKDDRWTTMFRLFCLKHTSAVPEESSVSNKPSKTGFKRSSYTFDLKIKL